MSRLWGVLGDSAGPAELDDVLGTGLTPRVPFRLAGHLKDELRGEHGRSRQEAVRAVVHRPPVLHLVDPRELLATQGGLDREGIRFYLGPAYPDVGLTYADREDPGNADPVVYVRARDRAHLILAGHHRATVALLRGQPLLTRLVVEDDDHAAHDPLHPGVSVVTPNLMIGPGPTRQPAWEVVPTADAAVQTLLRRGADHCHATARVAYAVTGWTHRGAVTATFPSPNLPAHTPSSSEEP